MARYKGSQIAKAVERDFPHFVDIVVPLGGLSAGLDTMYEFHTQYGIKPRRGHGRHDPNGSVIRCCFQALPTKWGMVTNHPAVTSIVARSGWAFIRCRSMSALVL